MPNILSYGIDRLRRLSRRFPRNVVCNICGWDGRRFNSDAWHRNSVCWNCHCAVRHRLMVAAWQKIPGVRYEDLMDGKRVLHFAPEPFLTPLVAKRAAFYRTADFAQGYDLQLDIQSMLEIGDGSYDLAIACDVLEHIPDDLKAMREIRRILAPGGWAVLTVPQIDGQEKTVGDPSITDPAERERLFGQFDHLRIYGSDIKQMLESAGFAVRVITADDFSPAMVKTNVLFPPFLSKHPLATNFRRIYFAQKQRS